MAKYIGGLSTPQNLPGYPEQRRDESGDWQHTERYWVDDANVDGTIPSDGSTTNQFGNTVTAPDGSTLECRDAQKSASSPGVKEVTLVFVPKGVDAAIKINASENPRRVSVDGQAIPIDDKRLLQSNGGPFTQTQIDDAKGRGYTSLPFYQVRYEYTKLDANFGWSESDITAAIQDTGNPPGLNNTTAAHWWKIGFNIQETTQGTEIRESWVYNPAGVVPL